jgi:hypothetical protein
LNTYARIAPRSGLAVKNFIDTGAGVVDYDYRGPVGKTITSNFNPIFIEYYLLRILLLVGILNFYPTFIIDHAF